MRKLLYINLCVSVISILFSCEKCGLEPPDGDFFCQNGNYSAYSNDTFEFEKKPLVSPSWGGPSFTFPDTFRYMTPVFCPQSEFEFIYSKAPEVGLEKKLYRFNFCNGSKTLLTENFYYNVDWGANGWIVFTGTGHNIYKIKEDGDSMMMISNTSNYDRAGKLNPSASFYWNDSDIGLRIEDLNGQLVKNFGSTSFLPVDWINDSILIGIYNGDLCEMGMYSENITILNSNWSSSGGGIYDRHDNTCYGLKTNGTGNLHFMIKHYLNGSNQVDTIYTMYDSYQFAQGTVSQNKIITQLNRQSWIDSLTDHRSYKSDILIMDKDGQSERIVNLKD